MIRSTSWFLLGLLLLAAYSLVTLVLAVVGSATQCGDGLPEGSAVWALLSLGAALSFRSGVTAELRTWTRAALALPFAAWAAFWVPFLIHVTWIGSKHCGGHYAFFPEYSASPPNRLDPLVHFKALASTASILVAPQTFRLPKAV